MSEFTINVNGVDIPVLWDIGPVPPLSIECKEFNRSCTMHYNNILFITKKINFKNISYIHINSHFMDDTKWPQITVSDIVYDGDHNVGSYWCVSISFVFGSERDYLKNKLRGIQ